MTNNSSEASCVASDVGGDRRDELFDVLSNARRRLVLHSLQISEREMSLSELTSDIVSWESDMTECGDVGEKRATVEIALTHTHIPKMTHAGFVSYDEEARTVTLTDRDDELTTPLGAVGSAMVGDD